MSWVTRTADIKKKLSRLNKINLSGFGRDFLSTWDKSNIELEAVLLTTQIIKDLYWHERMPKPFLSGLAISIFKDQSTRTRYSFAAASNLLGLQNAELDLGKSQMAHGETTLETANMVSFLSRAVGIRDDIYLGVGHNFMREFASSLDTGFKEKILQYRPSVINLQSDEDHPTQSVADMVHLINYFGGIDKLKNKKLVMSWAYSPSYGKPLSVPQGVIMLMSRYGMRITLAYPRGYNLIPEFEKKSSELAEKSGGSFETAHDMKQAFKGADIVYPKSWAPYKVILMRSKLLKKGDVQGLQELEKTALKQNAKHKDWECDVGMMKLTSQGKALYMHCLPADITGVSCKQGEVSARVFGMYRKQTYIQAGFKTFVIAAMIMLGQFGADTVNILSRYEKEN